MRTDGHTGNGNEWVAAHLDLELLKEWARRTLSKDWMVEVMLLASVLAVLGTVLRSLHNAMQHYIILGF